MLVLSAVGLQASVLVFLPTLNATCSLGLTHIPEGRVKRGCVFDLLLLPSMLVHPQLPPWALTAHFSLYNF